MILGYVWDFLDKQVFLIPSTATIFNQYLDVNSTFDLPNADKIRRENLRKYLECFQQKPKYLLIGEAPGPWGCRFSGVPFTSEAQLCRTELPFSGRQSSKRDKPYAANGAKIFWKVMHSYHPRFFVWDCIPFHPHNENDPLSIRAPTTKEINAYSEILSKILRFTQPEAVVAIGRKAEKALNIINSTAKYVRHPSRGGAATFKINIEDVFDE